MSGAATAYEEDRLADAEVALREAIAEAERADLEGLGVAAGLNALAVLVGDRGRVAEAMGLGGRALAIREKKLGPGHPDVAITLNNLAGYLALEGRQGEAEALYQRALAIQERALGPGDASTVATVRNLAALYVGQARYLAAAPLLARVVRARE